MLQPLVLTVRVFYETGDFRNASPMAPGAQMPSTQLPQLRRLATRTADAI